ncbi:MULTISPECIES: GNAT family N-acetyltransferase [Streptomyces]|uniref:GNAT family N-acetyltransferase n=1 Tax=Streptomyces luteosporeus TaxID=173856 RepID=A0ABN3TPK6_9ACTN
MTTTPRTAIVPVTEIFDLRHAVLRPGLPPESAVFAEDDLPDVFHVAAYDEGGAVVACATFFPEPLADCDAPAHRIRGMASAATVRGRGYGAAVLEAGLAEAAARGARVVWCNGRTVARGFYERHGFKVIGEEFEVEGIGPHFVCAREIAAPAAG